MKDKENYFISKKQWRALLETLSQSARVYYPEARGEDYRFAVAKAGQLSGGNLQKLILAREFSQKPFLLIAEQPTRGLDIGATEEIWQSLLRQREQGAILLVSGDMREVLSLADRILVIFRGQVMDIILCDDEQGLERIGLLMAGVRKGR